MLKACFKKPLTLGRFTFLALVLLVLVGVAHLVSIQAQGETSKTQAQQKGFSDLSDGLKAT